MGFAGLILLLPFTAQLTAQQDVKTGAVGQPPVLNLCFRFDSGIPAYSQRLIKEQALAYQPVLNSTFRFDCQAAPAIDVRFQQVASPPHPADALGAIRVRDGAIQPEILVFYEPIRMLLPVRLPGVEARALAKVLAHEISHLLSNRRTHRRSGLDAPVFSAGYLLSAAPRE